MSLCNLRKCLIFVLMVTIGVMAPISVFASFFTKSGQKPIFDVLDRDSGLSNLSVSGIIEDRYGFLWFGTQGGLNRYNGVEVEVFRNNPFEEDGLVHNLIQTMYYDQKNHEIWLGTYQGISRYQIETNTYRNYLPGEDSLSHSVIVAIAEDKDGFFWAGTLNGINRINPETDEITQYEIAGNVVRSIFLDSNDRLLVGTYEGLWYYDHDNDAFVLYDIELPEPFVMTIQEFEPGILTLGLWDGGVVQYDTVSGATDVFEFEDNRIYTVLQTRDGVLWAGSWGGGLFAVTDTGQYHFTTKTKAQKLAHPVVYSLHQDQSGILWVGTNGGGLNKINPRKVDYTLFRHDPYNPLSLSNGKINHMLRDRFGNFWVAVYNEGVERYDPETEAFIKYKADIQQEGSLPSNTVTVIAETDNQLLLGTGAGIAAYDYQSETFQTLPIIDKQNNVYSMAYDDKNQVLWIGTYENGLYRHDFMTGETQNINTDPDNNLSISDNLIYALLLDSKNRLWIGTNNGLNRIDSDQTQVIQYYRESGNRQTLAANNIRTIAEDSQGRIWIGSVGGGIARYMDQDDAFLSYTEAEGLSSNVIITILEGKDGRIWVATHDGISVLNPDTDQIDVFTPNDGIGGWEFSIGGYKEDDGSLLFSGIDGIISINADFTSHSEDKSPLYITKVSTLDQPALAYRTIYNDREFQFAARENDLGFHFFVLEYDAPERVNYFYRLLGFQDEWKNAGNHNDVSFLNLSPGSYVFEVYAETIRGIRTETASVSFTIATPWYLTYVAYIAYLLLFAFVIFGMVKLWGARVVKKRNEELALVNQKLELANDELENLSVKDSLTGLYNRRYFDQRIEELIHLARRSNSLISLAMVDIDNFKRFNDEYGHLAGDYLLMDLGEFLKENLPRYTDFVARYGGDEMVIVFYDTDYKGAEQVLEKIMEHVRSIKVREEFGTKPDYISITIGAVSMVPGKEATGKTYVEKADQAMYQAKTAGKNRLRFYR